MSCANGACISISVDKDGVRVTDTKLGDRSPKFTYAHAEWARLLDAVRGDGADGIIPDGHGGVTWYDPHCAVSTIVAFDFDAAEWDQFVADVHAGRYDRGAA